MSEIEIQSDIPLPSKSHTPLWAALRAMQVGQSCLIPDDYSYSNQLSGCANIKLKPKRFTSRKTAGGRRIWRIA